jgi:alkanesulfonate monooxygenase SsuD/methylene tetrahydromethanopterin reductase-like flavin-dependent oxidoreductase (luciferase family)
MGHIALSLLTFAADNAAFAQNLSEEERHAVQRLLDRRGTTATSEDRHKVLYRNYLGRIDPEDRDLVLPSLVDKRALVGTRDGLTARIARLEQAGVDELIIQPVVDPVAEMTEFAELAI